LLDVRRQGTEDEVPNAVHRDLSVPELVEHALERGEAVLTADGALRATTGKYTGRSPRDKFIVRHMQNPLEIAWGSVNQPLAPEQFERLQRKVERYLAERPHYVMHGYAGADPRHRIPVRVESEYAWHSLFMHQLLLRGPAGEPGAVAPFTILVAPGVQADPARDGTRSETFIALDFKRRIALIGGTEYAGEMKKSVFTVLNGDLPGRGVLPMHCSANVGERGDVALFFGLSGTGKTTLSADPSRRLIGDDEHGWSDEGVFNFEGGCYAKCIGLRRESEPQIWDAIRFGSVLENVVLDEPSRRPDYASEELTENTRAAYPVDYIPGAVPEGMGGHPSTVIFLTADATGVLPPVSRLTETQAMYHFLAGYTSKLAGTERGVKAPQPTFSTCFGEPFLPLAPMTYARMLGERIRRHGAQVYLVNTGWSGGPYGVGSRIALPFTRAIVRAAIDGSLAEQDYVTHPVFGLDMPAACPGVPSGLLDPRSTWADAGRYDTAAVALAQEFRANDARFELDPAVRAAGPKV
jgi:phosphoenolpyruvate carboxykinase (ATP)